MDARPIGVFDSGVGGLTVLHECLVTMPNEDFVYLGDHARLPYGPRPLDEINRFAHEIAGYLETQGVKLIVVACNTATSAALPALQEALTVPVVGVLAPEAAAAVRATRNRRIGLLATQATVTAGRYEALVRTLDAGVRFTAVACPKLVPLIEAGEQTVDAVREYAEPLEQAGCDTVILGCTHYPLISHMLQRMLGPQVTLISSGAALARQVEHALSTRELQNPRADGEGDYMFLCTGDVEAFREVGTRFLQMPLGAVERVQLAEVEVLA
jgi:glutamate racemase